jgi:hypothetical protein
MRARSSVLRKVVFSCTGCRVSPDKALFARNDWSSRSSKREHMSTNSLLLTILLAFVLVIDPAAGNAFADPSLSIMLVGSAMATAHVEPIAVSVAQAAAMLSLSRSQFYILIKAGYFNLIKITDKRSVIAVEELRRYLAERAAESVGKPIIPVANAAKRKKKSPIADAPTSISTAPPITPTPIASSSTEEAIPGT